MGAWILGITGVVCLGVLIEILLPDGQAGKYVKGAFSLLVVFAVAAPLPSVVKQLREWSPESSGIVADSGFLAVTAGGKRGPARRPPAWRAPRRRRRKRSLKWCFVCENVG